MKWKAVFAAGAIMLCSGSIYAQVENVTAGKPVIPIGLEFYSGGVPSVPYGSVTDGDFLPPWNDWNIGTVWWNLDMGYGGCKHPDSGEVCTLEIDLEGVFRIDSFIFQGDSDTYFLQYMDMDGGGWQTAWRVDPHPPGSGFFGAVQTRPNPLNNEEPYVLPEPIVTNMLRVIPSPPLWASDFLGTDDLYSVSEVQAFGEPTEPPPPPFVDCLELTCFEVEEKWEAFLTDEAGFCYKVELTCTDDVGGGMGANLHPDGRVEGGYGFFVSEEFPAENPRDCFGFFAHLGNEKAVHSCAFNTGEKIEMEIKAANMRRCAEEVATCGSPPPLNPE